MSRAQHDRPSELLTIAFPPALGETIRRLSRIANVEPREWIISTLEVYIQEFRSGKDRVKPDYSETKGSYYEDDDGCREPKRRL